MSRYARSVATKQVKVVESLKMNITFLTSKQSINAWNEVQPKISICFLTSKEVGVDLKEGYNGHLTSREAGSVGGQMVKKMSTVRTAKYIRADRTAIGHEIEVRYIAAITV